VIVVGATLVWKKKTKKKVERLNVLENRTSIFSDSKPIAIDAIGSPTSKRQANVFSDKFKMAENSE
jgi:hypothetical protein